MKRRKSNLILEKSHNVSRSILSYPVNKEIEMKSIGGRSKSTNKSKYNRKYENSGKMFVENMGRQIEKLLDRSARKKIQRKRFEESVY